MCAAVPVVCKQRHQRALFELNSLADIWLNHRFDVYVNCVTFYKTYCCKVQPRLVILVFPEGCIHDWKFYSFLVKPNWPLPRQGHMGIIHYDDIDRGDEAE